LHSSSDRCRQREIRAREKERRKRARHLLNRMTAAELKLTMKKLKEKTYLKKKMNVKSDDMKV